MKRKYFDEITFTWENAMSCPQILDTGNYSPEKVNFWLYEIIPGMKVSLFHND